MSTYESGFAQGERDAYFDRRRGLVREQTHPAASADEKGYWDAYTPRSATWGATARTPAKPIAYEEAV